MRFWRRHPKVRAALATLTLTLQGACTSWRTQQVAPAELFGEKPPGEVRLTLLDSSRQVIHSPALRNDSVVGLKRPHGTKGSGHSPYQKNDRDTVVPAVDSAGVALTDVHSVAVKKRAPLKAVGLTVGILGGLMLVAVAACANDCYELEFDGGGYVPEY